MKRKLRDLFFIGVQLLKRCREHRLSRSAAEITYYFLFTLFPLIIFAYSVLSMLNVPIEEILARLEHIIPLELSGMLFEYFDYVGGMSRSFMLYAGSILAVYMLFKAITSLNYAVRRASNEEQPRSVAAFFSSLIPSVMMMLVILGSLILFSISRSVYSYIAVYFELDGWVKLFSDLLRFAAGPVILFFVLSLYYYVASGKKHSYKTTIPGSVLAISVWYIFSLAFVSYVNTYGRYTNLYGSLASIMVLMIWFHTTAGALIIGAEFNEVLRNYLKLKNEDKKRS